MQVVARRSCVPLVELCKKKKALVNEKKVKICFVSFFFSLYKESDAKGHSSFGGPTLSDVSC